MPIDDEINEGRLFAVLGYIGFLFIIPLLFKKDNLFAKYHAKQGMVLFFVFLFSIFLKFVPFLGVYLKDVILYLYILGSSWGILQAIKGNYCRIIIISDIAENIKI